MPRKLRELRADLRRSGFTIDHQTGSHQVWKHPQFPGIGANMAGRDGADAKRYQECQVRQAPQALREAQEGQRTTAVSEKFHYSMLIQWSHEDRACLVTLPEWEGRAFNPVTHGDTYEEAGANGRDALEALVTAARKHGESPPEPRVFADAAAAAAPAR